jgi:ABC-type glycerol-3-phosphate transport system substrate-binding protein
LGQGLGGILALGGAAGLAACGAPAEPGPPEAGGAPSGAPVRLTYLHQWSQTQGHGPVTETLVARFNEQHPTVQVEGVYTADYYAKLSAVLAGGDFPDVVTYNLSFVPLLVKKGVVVPAESLFRGSERLNPSDLIPAARAMATFEGKLGVTPYALNSSGLALNTSLFRKRGLEPGQPPATWNDLLEQARRLTGTDGEKAVWGTVFPRGTADPVSPLLAFAWQNGAELVDVQRRAAVWNSPAGIEALQFQVDLVHRHRVAPFPTPANGNQGDVAIWHIPPGGVSGLQLTVKDAFEWTTAELPRGKRQATTVGGHSLAVLKTNRHHEAAWRFVHYWVQAAQNAEYLVASATLPPWRASEQHQTWQRFTREEPRIQPFVRMLGYARPTPSLTRWEEIIAILQRERDAAGAQQKSPKEALDDAARAADPLIQEG